MSFGDYLQGSIELIAVAAAMAYAAVGLRGRLLPGWSGASARLAEVVLGLSLLVVILELVGVVGLYRPGWILAATLIAGIGLGAALRGGRARAEPPIPPVPPAALHSADIVSALRDRLGRLGRSSRGHPLGVALGQWRIDRCRSCRGAGTRHQAEPSCALRIADARRNRGDRRLPRQGHGGLGRELPGDRRLLVRAQPDRI